MSTRSKTDWLQLTTLLSIVVGVGLVVYELSQSRELVETELTTAIGVSDTQQLMVLTGEDVASSLARACVDHESLSDRDILVLRRFYEIEWRRIRGLQMLEEWSGERSWELYARWVLAEIFETHAGQIWAQEWLERAGSYYAEGKASEQEADAQAIRRHNEIMSDVLAEVGPPSCSKVLSRYRSPPTS